MAAEGSTAPPPSLEEVGDFEAELFLPCGNKLGECPRWDEGRAVICWLDIDGRAFWRCTPDAEGLEVAERFELPARAGSFCWTESGEYVFAFEDGFSFYNPEDRKRLRITPDFEPGLRTRLNDGRVDNEGRFVVGGHMEKGSEPLTAVYRLNTDLSVECLYKGVRCSNSICFSGDGAMFFTDTMGASSPEIWRFPDYAASGMQGPYEVFSRPAGKPDGSAIDADGCLWNAEFGGGRVVRYRHDGSIGAVVRVPTRYTTCVAFGDADLRTLYITDASISRLSKKKLEDLSPGHPGGLFRVRLPHAGLPERRFLGSSASLPSREASASEIAAPAERRGG